MNEKLPNGFEVQEATTVDSRGVSREMAVVARPESASLEGKVPGVLLVAGIPRGMENTNHRPFEYHPFFAYCAKELAKNNINSLAVSPAGMGNSNADTFEESLAKRIDALAQATQEFVALTNTDPGHIRIVGSSMGGHIALRLIEKLAKLNIRVDKILLSSPAAYSQEAELAPFGNEFSTVLRKGHPNPDESPAIQALKAYDGELMLTYMEDDQPIPPDIQTAYKDLVGAKLTKIIVGVDHGFRLGGKHHEPTMAEFSQLAAQFLS